MASTHPEVNLSNWSPPQEGEARSPCPAINALANHNLLPRTGTQITKETCIRALTSALNLDPHLAALFTSGALATNPDHSQHTFDLAHVRQHNSIEHDVSLSRTDVAFGDASVFDKEMWAEYLKGYDGTQTTSYEAASKGRWERYVKSRERHKREGKSGEFTFGVKECLFSYGETALWMNILGEDKDGKIPVEWLRIFFEEERLPYKEGWRPPAQPITQTRMNETMLKLVMANEHRGHEAMDVGLGTVHAMTNALASFVKSPSWCVVM